MAFNPILFSFHSKLTMDFAKLLTGRRERELLEMLLRLPPDIHQAAWLIENNLARKIILFLYMPHFSTLLTTEHDT
jgi:hypothetical protein